MRNSLAFVLAVSLYAVPALGQSGPAAAPDNPLSLKVHHITASATDVDRAAKWYQEVLGFRLDLRTARGAMQVAELSIPGFGIALTQQGQRGGGPGAVGAGAPGTGAAAAGAPAVPTAATAPAVVPAPGAGPAAPGGAPAAGAATPPGGRGQGGAPAGPRWIHIVFGVADPAKTLELVKARGGAPRVRGAAGAPVTSFLINDSEGNEIEFVALDATPILR